MACHPGSPPDNGNAGIRRRRLIFPGRRNRTDRIIKERRAVHAVPLRRSARADPRSATGTAAGRTVRGLRPEPGQRSGTGAGRPRLGRRFPFDGEDAESIVASIFSAPGDTVQAERWDGLRLTLSSVPDAAACLRVCGLSEAAAATLALPLTLTKRSCIVYATKAAQMSRTQAGQY